MHRERDAELVALARRGHKEAFGDLVERYQQMARRVALGMVGNEDIAQGLAQEAMLRAYLSLGHLRDPERFGSWLYGIVLNVCRSFIRDQRGEFLSWEALEGGLRFDVLAFSGATPGPQEILEQQELHRVILKAVNALPLKARRATLLFYYEGLSQREIAAILGISVTAVKGRLHKARKRLRGRLAPIYSEMGRAAPTKGREKPMVEVTVADVIRKKAEEREHHILVLLDEAGRRILPIWIGRFESEMMALHLLEHQLPRPLTYDFTASLLEASGGQLEEVRVEALKESTFYAVVRLRCGDAVREVDARPSDAINLALHTGCPISVTEEVMEEAGIAIPEEFVPTEQMGKGLEGIQGQFDEMREKWAKERPRLSKEERVKVHQEAMQELMAFLFGPET